MAITVLLFFAANSAAITMLQPRLALPRLLAVLPPSCRAPPLMQLSNDASFLNDPFQYISDHPEMFSDDVRVMAAYQQTLQDSALNLWGDLPEKLDECAERAATLRTKSARAFELAQIILQAEHGTMQTLAADSTFQEKKLLFDTLAGLPDDYRGISAVEEVVQSVIDWGPQGPQARFGEDLQRAIAKVTEANDALEELNRAYSTLFLSVRTVRIMSSTAAQASQGQLPPPRR